MDVNSAYKQLTKLPDVGSAVYFGANSNKKIVKVVAHDCGYAVVRYGDTEKDGDDVDYFATSTELLYQLIE